jgi:hypothetical protein
MAVAGDAFPRAAVGCVIPLRHIKATILRETSYEPEESALLLLSARSGKGGQGEQQHSNGEHGLEQRHGC